MEPELSLLHSKESQPVPLLSQINPVHAPHPTSLRSILILSYHLGTDLPRGPFRQASQPKLYMYLSSVNATCCVLRGMTRVHIISLHSITF